MSSGNTQSCLRQQSWQRGNSTSLEKKPWAIHVPITDAIDKAKLILEKIDEQWQKGMTLRGELLSFQRVMEAD